MWKPTGFAGLVLVSAASLGLTAGCNSDCSVYCDRYQECLASDLDVDRCVNTCEAWAEDSDASASRAAECAECVQDKTCAEAFASCVDDCLGVPIGR